MRKSFEKILKPKIDLPFLNLDNKISILVPQDQSTPVNSKKMAETFESQDWFRILNKISNLIRIFLINLHQDSPVETGRNVPRNVSHNNKTIDLVRSLYQNNRELYQIIEHHSRLFKMLQKENEVLRKFVVSLNFFYRGAGYKTVHKTPVRPNDGQFPGKFENCSTL